MEDEVISINNIGKIEYVNEIVHDEYTEHVICKFDIQDDKYVRTVIPMIDMSETESFKWNIGCICGSSGSGKSSILNKLGGVKKAVFDNNLCVCSQFKNLTPEETVDILQAVGLNSIPLYLNKPYQLSNGQMARLEIAWQIVNNDGGIILIDEFTSVVNRECAFSISHCLQKYVRMHNLKLVVATCHFDLFNTLKPDWVFNLNKTYDGICELEHLVYSDSDEYSVYSHVPDNVILSKEYEIK